MGLHDPLALTSRAIWEKPSGCHQPWARHTGGGVGGRGLWCNALTQLLDEVLHVQAQGVEGGGPALVVLLVDGDGGQAATHSPLLKYVDLYPGPEVLLEEMGYGGAPDSGPNHGCQQARAAERGETVQGVVRPQVPR